MQMISYWKNWRKTYEDDGSVLIIGWYDHKNQENGGEKALGVHWSDAYPQPRGALSPCVIPTTTRNAILSGPNKKGLAHALTKNPITPD